MPLSTDHRTIAPYTTAFATALPSQPPYTTKPHDTSQYCRCTNPSFLNTTFIHTMMLATPFYSQHLYTPSRPSPLSERSANAAPHTFRFTMASPLQNEKKQTVPQRVYKANPVVQTRDVATKRRRDMFFKRVQKDRDDKKWDARGEQVRRITTP